MMKISSIFVDFLENMNFTYEGWYYGQCSAYVGEGLVGLVTMVISVLKEN